MTLQTSNGPPLTTTNWTTFTPTTHRLEDTTHQEKPAPLSRFPLPPHGFALPASHTLSEMATIEGVYLADDRDNLIFEYPTSASSPSLKTVLSTLRASSTPSISTSNYGRHNDAIVEVSRSHTVYRRTHGRLVAYAFVRQQDYEESLHLKTIGHLEDDDDEEVDDDDEDDDDNGDSDNDGYDQLDELDASVAAAKEHKKQKGKKQRTKSSPSINPNFVFVFLHRVIATLLDYFGSPLNPLKIEAHYDVMCNLMQELVQGGMPYITDLNSLRELVPFKGSLASTILSTTNQMAKNYVSGGASSFSSLTSGSRGGAISSNDLAQERVPWRKQNIKYTNNEIFVDITETINVVLSPHQVNHRYKNGTSSKSHIATNKLFTTVAVLEGKIDFTSHLSGIPDVLLQLSMNGHTFGPPSFHRCIRVDKWNSKEGTLSFIPPDGKSTLARYTLELDRIPTQRAQKSLGLITPDYRHGLGVKGNEFELSIGIALQKGVSKIDQMSIVVSMESHQSLKILRLSHGDVQTNKQGRCEWVFEPGQKLGVTAVMRGIVEDSTDEETNVNGNDPTTVQTIVHYPRQVALSYQLKGALPSGIRVDSLKIVRGMGDVVPYKGVKYITRTGDYIIR